jgi:hypothetical protein
MRVPNPLAQAVALLATVGVGVLAMTCAARAVTTVNTPNVGSLSYNLAANGDSLGIFPPLDQPVLILGDCTTAGSRGVGHVVLVKKNGGGFSWAGQNSPTGGAIAHGAGVTTAGTQILSIEASAAVTLRINDSTSFVIHNGAASIRSGFLTLFW